MHLPANIGDYTDFYSSLDHATNVSINMQLFVQPICKIMWELIFNQFEIEHATNVCHMQPIGESKHNQFENNTYACPDVLGWDNVPWQG